MADISYFFKKPCVSLMTNGRPSVAWQVCGRWPYFTALFSFWDSFLELGFGLTFYLWCRLSLAFSVIGHFGLDCDKIVSFLPNLGLKIQWIKILSQNGILNENSDNFVSIMIKCRWNRKTSCFVYPRSFLQTDWTVSSPSK